MKNILQIIDYAAPYKGNFILSLVSLGNEVSPGKMVYLMPESASGLAWVNDFVSDGNVVYFIERSFFQKKVRIKNLKRLLFIIKRENVGLIHTHFVNHNFTLFLLKLISSVKVISHLHNHYIVRGKLVWVKKKVFDLTSDLFIGVSDSVTNCAKNIFASEKVLSIRNSIVFSRLSGEIVKNTENIGSDFEILVLGWPYHRKGLDIAIRAVKELIPDGKKIKLNILLAGGVDIVKKEIIADFGEIPDFVCFLAPTDAIIKYYNSNNVLLSASREEGFNYTLVEGAFANCLLISSNIPGIPRDIPHIQLFKPEDVNELTKAIRSVMDWNPNDIRKIKEEQKTYVEEEFSILRWSSAVADCYRKLLLK